MAKVILGNEFDRILRERTRRALLDAGGRLTSSERGVAGSQEVDTEQWSFGVAILVLEAETYMGLSLSGPEDLVGRVTAALNRSRLPDCVRKGRSANLGHHEFLPPLMKYDDASWHNGGNLPHDLPDSAGANHIAIFLAWTTLHGLASEYHTSEFREEFVRLQARIVTPIDWFATACDWKFTDEDLNKEGNAFARSYYGEPDRQSGSYLDDYARCFPTLPSLYHVPATWRSYDTIAPILSRRLKTWRRGRWLMRLVGW